MHCIGWLERFQRSDAGQARCRGSDPAVFTGCRMRPFVQLRTSLGFTLRYDDLPMPFDGQWAQVPEGEIAPKRNAGTPEIPPMSQRSNAETPCSLRFSECQ